MTILIPLVVCIFFSLSMLILPCFAQGEFETEEELVFEEEFDVDAPIDESSAPTSFVDQFMGDSIITLGYKFSYGTGTPEDVIDCHSFLRLKYSRLVGEKLFFSFEGKVSLHLENDHLAQAEEQEFYVDGSTRELYLQPGFEKFNLTFGKQVVVWGKADASAVTDVVSPRDLSEYLFIELEDARRGQWMVSGNWFEGQWDTFVFLSLLPETDELPIAGSRYYRQLKDRQGIDVVEPEFGDLEFGLKLDTIFSKTDISLMAGRFYSNSSVYSSGGDQSLKQIYPSYLMAGIAASHAWKNYIFKLEAAVKNNYPLQGMSGEDRYFSSKKDLIDMAAGFEYNANDKYQVSLELANRFILSGASGLNRGTDENSTAVYTTVSKDFLNQTLELEYRLYQHLQANNRFQQFKITWDLTDDIDVEADYTFFNVKDDDSQMWLFRNEDRIGLEIRYTF